MQEKDAAMQNISTEIDKIAGMLNIHRKKLILFEQQATFGRFVQGIVHNIKNPLGVVMLNLEMARIEINRLTERTPVAEPHRIRGTNEIITSIEDYIKNAMRCTVNIKDIIDTLLQKGRSDISSDKIKIDLNVLIRQELNFLESDLRYKHLKLKKIEINEHPIYVEVVPGLISQVIENIVWNAIEELDGEDDQCLVIRTGVTDDTLAWFSICDNGAGMDGRTMKKLFTPYFSTKTRNKNGNGTGLGLWICKQIIEEHDGIIEVTSKKKLGTTFTVRMPMTA